MTHEAIVDLIRNTVLVSFYLAAPMLGCGLIVGLGVSIFQAITQINEATLTFVPKIAAILVALVLFSPWMLDVMTTFTHEVFEQAALWPR